MAFSFGLEGRRQAHARAKQAIAAQAADLVAPGQRLMLDAGTTVLELAHLLRDRKDLTVITPSLAVAAQLQFSEGIEVILVGGSVRSGAASLAGVVTETVLDMLQADLAFTGTDGVDLDGNLYTADLRVARVDQLIRSRAAKTYVLADSSKIDQTALVRHGRLGEVEALITDDGVARASLAKLRRAGKVIVVKAGHSRPSRPRAKEHT
jgi:DeoR/GlpR family transcriptional regulator of sugar metabolism